MLLVSSTNSQPAFGSSRALSKAGNFAKSQFNHALYQGMAWGLSETISPSTNLSHAIGRKIIFDIGETIATLAIKKTTNPEVSLKIGNHCTNVFAYIADGIRALGKITKK